jgi:mannose-6-phosphate isomerase-like protein (cupin superfamily)
MSPPDPFPLVSPATAEHYGWGAQCHAWFLLKRETLHVIEELMPPGAREVRHYHRHATQFFYVLAGELSMESGPARTTIPAGQGVVVSPGQPHQAVNASAKAVRFLVVSSPPSHGDRVDIGEDDRTDPAR